MSNEKYIDMDPNILLSIINMKLRDFYSSLNALCEDMNINQEALIEKLNAIGYEYDEGVNQFK